MQTIIKEEGRTVCKKGGRDREKGREGRRKKGMRQIEVEGKGELKR